MPTTPAIKGQSAYWGVPSGSYGAGVVTRITRDLDGEVAFLYDGNGYTISEILFDDKETFTIELVMDATNFTLSSLPVRGTELTILLVANCIVQKRGIVIAQKEWQMATLTAMNFANITS